MSTILQLAPQNVWKHFYSLTQIPRPSGHMEKITKFLIDFGKGLGLESFVDEVGNVIIRKPATPGMEKSQRHHPSGAYGHGASEEQRYYSRFYNRSH